MDHHAQTLRTSFTASSGTTSEEIEKRARKLADDFFAGRPYHLDVNVDEHRTVGGDSLGYEVTVTAELAAREA